MSGDGDKRRETASRLRPGRESVGLGPRTPRSVPRPAWHPPASTQAPGWSGPARRAKVAAKTAPPLARRRCLRLGAVGRGGGAVCPSVRGRDAGLSTWAGTRGADGGQALGPRRLRAALPRTGAMDRFPFSGPRLLPRHGPVGTRGLAFWGPGKWKSEPTSVKEGVQAFKEFGHDHKFRRHGEALTLLLGPQGWDGGGGAFVLGGGRASSKRKQSSGHPAELTGCLSSVSESFPALSRRRAREQRLASSLHGRPAFGVLKRVARRGCVESGCPRHLGTEV